MTFGMILYLLAYGILILGAISVLGFILSFFFDVIDIKLPNHRHIRIDRT